MPTSVTPSIGGAWLRWNLAAGSRCLLRCGCLDPLCSNWKRRLMREVARPSPLLRTSILPVYGGCCIGWRSFPSIAVSSQSLQAGWRDGQRVSRYRVSCGDHRPISLALSLGSRRYRQVTNIGITVQKRRNSIGAVSHPDPRGLGRLSPNSGSELRERGSKRRLIRPSLLLLADSK